MKQGDSCGPVLRVVALAVMAALTACQAQKTWYREGATQQDFYVDQGQCKAQAFSGAASMMQAALVFSSCMQGHGWHLEQSTQPAEVYHMEPPA
jgi:hypothetical protein